MRSMPAPKLMPPGPQMPQMPQMQAGLQAMRPQPVTAAQRVQLKAAQPWCPVPKRRLAHRVRGPCTRPAAAQLRQPQPPAQGAETAPPRSAAPYTSKPRNAMPAEKFSWCSIKKRVNADARQPLAQSHPEEDAKAVGLAQCCGPWHARHAAPPGIFDGPMGWDVIKCVPQPKAYNPPAPRPHPFGVRALHPQPFGQSLSKPGHAPNHSQIHSCQRFIYKR